jgi:hypothetical protein
MLPWRHFVCQCVRFAGSNGARIEVIGVGIRLECQSAVGRKKALRACWLFVKRAKAIEYGERHGFAHAMRFPDV